MYKVFKELFVALLEHTLLDHLPLAIQLGKQPSIDLRGLGLNADPNPKHLRKIPHGLAVSVGLQLARLRVKADVERIRAKGQFTLDVGAVQEHVTSHQFVTDKHLALGMLALEPEPAIEDFGPCKHVQGLVVVAV